MSNSPAFIVAVITDAGTPIGTPRVIAPDVFAKSREQIKDLACADFDYKVITEIDTNYNAISAVSDKTATDRQTLKNLQSEVKFLREELRRLGGALTERRSDISDEIFSILEGNKFQDENLEKRYACGNLPLGGRVVYDTLTTLISFEPESGDKYIKLEMDYLDDTFNCMPCGRNNLSRLEMSDGYSLCRQCDAQL